MGRKIGNESARFSPVTTTSVSVYTFILEIYVCININNERRGRFRVLQLSAQS